MWKKWEPDLISALSAKFLTEGGPAQGRQRRGQHCPLSCSALCRMPHHPDPFSGAACSQRKQGSHGTWALSSLSFQPGFPWVGSSCVPLSSETASHYPETMLSGSHILFLFYFSVVVVVVVFTLPSYLNSNHRFWIMIFCDMYVNLALQHVLRTAPLFKYASSLGVLQTGFVSDTAYSCSKLPKF